MHIEQINTVIFDLDNTLINRKRAFEEFANRLVERYILVSNSSKKTETLQYIIEADNDGYRSKKELYQELLDNLKWKKETQLQELLDYWFSEFFKCTVLMDGAMEVIQYLRSRGLKLGLITNGSVHSQNSKIDYAGLRHSFHTIVVSDEVKVKKPDKEIFNIALERLGAKPETSIYIGDHPLNDIKGASNAGLGTVWLAGFREWDVVDTQPQHTIKNLRDVISIL